VNPAVLREKEFTIRPTPEPKKVLVIGGGLAGMEAARTLAERGHQVSLYERNSFLGGQWAIAAGSEHKGDYKALIPFMVRGMEKAGVQVHMNTEANRRLVGREAPQVVVIATGAMPRSIHLESPEAGGPNIVQANDVLLDKARVGNRVVVVGGRYLGMEAADLLARQGKHVSLVEALELGHHTQRFLKAILRDRLVENGVYFYPQSSLLRITLTGVDVANNGSRLHLKADTVVLAIGTQPVDSLSKELEGLGIELYKIGDCVEPRDAMEAIHEGAEIGRAI